ncbi:MAG: hypothetical protein AAF512_19290, partial [Pseudomonadota bacterium]
MNNAVHTAMSRTSIQRDHALIAPESHVPLNLPDWNSVDAIVLISAEMGAGFSQILAHCKADASLSPLDEADEMFVLVMEGKINVEFGDENW